MPIIQSEMERFEEELIRRSEPESLVSVTVGRFMSTLLSARPKKLRESISRLSPDSQKGSSGKCFQFVLCVCLC